MRAHASPWAHQFAYHAFLMPRERSTDECYCGVSWGRGPERYRNNGSRTHCQKCKRRKGDCFYETVKAHESWRKRGGASSESSKLKAAEAKLRKQTEELDKLKAAANDAPGKTAGVGGGRQPTCHG